METTGGRGYALGLEWTGNRGEGTAGYAAYGRRYRLTAPGKPDLEGTAAPAFLGEPGLHDPEELLLGAVSACHMLFFLALCARAGIVVTRYVDAPLGTLELHADGGGAFRDVTLRPQVTLAPGMDAAAAQALHAVAGARCFIARSCRFPVHHDAHVEVAP